MQIAVDTAGGDFAPRNIVDGALVAARHLGFGLTLVGRAKGKRFVVLSGADRIVYDAATAQVPEESAKIQRKASLAEDAA